jgi:hypothetical protein
MTKQVQRRRGTATQHTSFTGAEGEISVNTTNKSVHVHDGVTAGGVEAARADLSNVSDANLNTALAGNTLSSLTITSADINGGTIDGTVIGGSTPAAISGTTGQFGTSLNVDGTVTADGLTVAGNISVDGGTIKLDGNYPVGTGNVALGDAALDDGSLSGGYNTAIGRSSLTANTTGAENTGIGNQTLQANTSGSNNNALGTTSLYSNTTGSNNTAAGYQSLFSNTAVGYPLYSAGDGYLAAIVNTGLWWVSGRCTFPTRLLGIGDVFQHHWHCCWLSDFIRQHYGSSKRSLWVVCSWVEHDG